MPDIVVHTGFGAEALQQSDIEIGEVYASAFYNKKGSKNIV